MPPAIAAIAVAALASGLAQTASAEPPAGSFSWTRATGADTCPARERLLEELDRELARPLLTALEGRAVEAVITHAAAGWDVTLYWRAPDGTGAGTRQIHDDGATCEGAVRNTIVSIAVALAANAVDARPSSPPSKVTGSTAPPPSPPTSTAPALPPPAVPVPMPPTASGPGPGDVLLGGVVAVGWLPGVAYGVQLVAEPVVSGRMRATLTATALAETAQKLQGVSAGFAAVEFGADLCGVLLSHPQRWIEASACGGLRAGVVQAFVYSGPQNAGGGQGSFALEAGGELRSNPLGPLLLGLTFFGRVNATRYELAGSSAGAPVYTQDVGGFVTTLRLGMRFP